MSVILMHGALVVQGVQPQHSVNLAPLLQVGQVFLAPLKQVPASLPGVGRHLDPQVPVPGAVDVVGDPLTATVAPLLPLAGEATGQPQLSLGQRLGD